jgi:hypothetical protein
MTDEKSRCECGEELPLHMVALLASHTCSCRRHYKVISPRTERAVFKLDGTRANPFAEFDAKKRIR